MREALSLDEPKMSDDAVCLKCFGTGTYLKEGAAVQCPDCARKRRQEFVAALLNNRPERFRHVMLETLEPRDDLHPKQSEIVAYMRANPGDNYYFCGKEDTGKTHFLHALYGHAVTAGNSRVLYTTMNDLVLRTKEGFTRGGDMQHDWLRIADLQQSSTRFSVFIDDIDKARATEFVGELIFAWIDAIYSFKHQLVVTSQLDPEKRVNGLDSLAQHFEKADPRYAKTIVRRIVNDETAVWRMF